MSLFWLDKLAFQAHPRLYTNHVAVIGVALLVISFFNKASNTLLISKDHLNRWQFFIFITGAIISITLQTLLLSVLEKRQVKRIRLFALLTITSEVILAVVLLAAIKFNDPEKFINAMGSLILNGFFTIFLFWFTKELQSQKKRLRGTPNSFV